MFTVSQRRLASPSAFRDPQRLLALMNTTLARRSRKRNRQRFLRHNADFRIRAILRRCCCFDSSEGALTGTGERSRQFRPRNTSLFRLLGVQPFMGRDFRPEEDSRVTTCRPLLHILAHPSEWGRGIIAAINHLNGRPHR